MKLVNRNTGIEAKPGDIVMSFRGEPFELVSFYARPAPSTGRVVVMPEGEDVKLEYYPQVFELEIVP